LPEAGRDPAGRFSRGGLSDRAIRRSQKGPKVKRAALAKIPGGTIERVETDVDHGSPYEAHVRKSDGTELEVMVNEDFEVTAVNTMGR
jgi:hypothetical protein